MQAEVGTADFSEICLLVSVAGKAHARISKLDSSQRD